MTDCTCTICCRGSALSGGPIRFRGGHAICPACWDTLACSVLDILPSADQPPEQRRAATADERGTVALELLATVAHRVRRGA